MKISLFSVVITSFILLPLITSADNSALDWLFSDGYKYIIIGCKNTDGIRLFDLSSKDYIQLIQPQGREIRFRSPVIGKSGIGYCIREEGFFNYRSKQVNIIKFNLRNLKYQSTGLEFKHINGTIALSPDEKEIAIVTQTVKNTIPKLCVFDLASKTLKSEISIGKDFEYQYVEVFWNPISDQILVIDWSADGIAKSFDLKTEKLKAINRMELMYEYSCGTLVRRKGSVSINRCRIGDQITIPISHLTAHLFKLSKDCKFMFYGYLKGKGFQTLVFWDLNSKSEKVIELEHHPSYYSGFDIW